MICTTSAWRKRGTSGDRAEVLLEALAALGADFPRGKSDPPVQIHVHQCVSCGKVEAGGRELGRADAERVQCDAAIAEPGKRNTTTIPPKTRREVLARDRHRCQAPGCGRTRFLEVHHKTSAGPWRHPRTRESHHPVRVLPSAVARAAVSGAYEADFNFSAHSLRNLLSLGLMTTWQ